MRTCKVHDTWLKEWQPHDWPQWKCISLQSPPNWQVKKNPAKVHNLDEDKKAQILIFLFLFGVLHIVANSNQSTNRLRLAGICFLPSKRDTSRQTRTCRKESVDHSAKWERAGLPETYSDRYSPSGKCPKRLYAWCSNSFKSPSSFVSLAHTSFKYRWQFYFLSIWTKLVHWSLCLVKAWSLKGPVVVTDNRKMRPWQNAENCDYLFMYWTR